MNGIQDRRGNVFLASLAIVAILAIISVAYLSRNVVEHRLTSKSYSSAAALALAEAGIDLGSWEVNHAGTGWSGWSGASNYKTKSVTSFQAYDGSAIGDFDVTVTGIDTDTITITSTAYVPNKTSPEAQRTVEVKLASSNYLFKYGVFSKEDISWTGNVGTDSYNSANGSYGGSNINTNGDIGSNGDVSLGGSVDVSGTATYGAGDSISGADRASGGGSEAASDWDVPEVPPADIDAAENNNNNNNIV